MKFGDIVYTTKEQDTMRAIPHIPIGTKCVVIEVVDLPGYDLLVVPENYKMIVVDERGTEQDYHEVYLYRNSWKTGVSKKTNKVHKPLQNKRQRI